MALRAGITSALAFLPHPHPIFHKKKKKKRVNNVTFSSNAFSWVRNSFSALLKFFPAGPRGRNAISKPGLLECYMHGVLTSNGTETQLYLQLAAADPKRAQLK